MARQAIGRAGLEIRLARVGAGLSVDAVAAAVGCSNAEISRIERGLALKVPLERLSRAAAAVGLDLVVRTHPGGDPLRDAGQHATAASFATFLPPTLRWSVEVPLPIAGDPRAWDGLVAGDGWRYGVEVETQPTDAQALLRRLHLKERDGQVDGLLLVMPDTRRVRMFVRAASAELRSAFPIPGPVALARLRAGTDPGGSAAILLPRRHTRGV